MAQFSRLITTYRGRALIAEAFSEKKQIEFTQVSASDKAYVMEELETLEEFEGIRQKGVVSKVTRTADTTVRIETVLTNTELTEGYYMRTVGLYAKTADGAEILYAAAVENSGNCHMPAFEGTTVSGAYISLITTVSNAENVSIEVSDSVYATIGDIKDLQEQIDNMEELLEGNMSLSSLNAAKLDSLERIGMCVMIKEFTIDKEASYGRDTSLFHISKSELAVLNNKTYYLFILDTRPGGYLTVYDTQDESKDIDGTLMMGMTIRADSVAAQYFPISRNYNTLWYAVSVNLMDVGGINPSDEISIYAYPDIREKTAEGQWVQPQGRLNIEGYLRLRVFKLGYVLASISEGESGGGGVGGNRDYNILSNKPSINNVTLKGNLTTEQLGLDSSGGSAELSEYTEEEVLAVLT